MEEQKKYIKELIAKKNFEIEKYHNDAFEKKHRSFTGTPKTNLHDKSKIILLIDPFTKNEKFIEFPISSVGYIEELGTITADDGRSALKVRLWVKKGSVAFETRPFLVE